MKGRYTLRRWIALAVLLCLALVMPGLLPSPAQAADPPIILVMGGTGSTPWSEHIKPGFSGTQTVTLKNAGSTGGTVYIWLSDILSEEGDNPEPETGDTAEPGELDLYLLLGLTAPGLNSNITLPALLGDFPDSMWDTDYIRIPIAAGQTITLEWQWALPPETGNDVQGDTLSFSINYSLDQLPASGGGGGGIAYPLGVVPSTTQPEPEAEAACPGVSPGDVVKFNLEIVNLAKTDANNVTVTYDLPEGLIVTAAETHSTVSFTEQRIIANLGTIESGKSKTIAITVRITSKIMPGTPISTLLLRGWLAIRDAAQACAEDQYSLGLSQLTVTPLVTWSIMPLAQRKGEKADILVKVTNICEVWRYNAIFKMNGATCCTKEVAHTEAADQNDDYTVALKINSSTIQTKKVSLSKGESQVLAFTNTPVRRTGSQFLGSLSGIWWIIPTGKYLVDVNGLRGQLTSELWINWLIILIVIIILAVLIWWLSRRNRIRQQYTPRNQGPPYGQTQIR